MFIPKKYGQSKIDKCPFCGKQATVMSKQDVPVCLPHKDERLEDLKCVCGSYLEMLHGKFGVFFSCMKCGNMSMKKVLEFNEIKPTLQNENLSKKKTQPKEMTVRSDDPRYFE